MRRGLAVAAALLVLVALAPAARACSCAGGDPRAALSRADAAFIGTVTSAPRPNGESRDSVAWEFSVERSVKGDLGSHATVWSYPDGASCGLELRHGERIGLFVNREGERWTSSLCSQISPERLLEAAQPLPPPDGSGPAAFVVSGRFGDYGVLALDDKGRTLAYGKAGPEGAARLSVCPGGKRVVTLANRPEGALATLYGLPGLGVLRTRDVSQDGSWLAAVGCGDAAGNDIYVFCERSASPQSTLTLYRLRRNEPPAAVWTGPGSEPVFDPGGRFAVVRVREPASLTRVDLPSGAARLLAATPEPPKRMAVHPTGRSVLVLTGDLEQSYGRRLMVIGMDGRTVAEREVSRFEAGTLLWSGDDQVTVTVSQTKAQTLDGRLQPVAEWEGRLGPAAVRDGRIYTLSHEGDVHAADARSGGLTPFRDLPSGEFLHLAAVPRPKGSPTPPTTAAPTPTTAVTAASTPEPTAPPTTWGPGPQLAAEPTSSTEGEGVPGVVSGLALLVLLATSFATQAVARRTVRAG